MNKTNLVGRGQFIGRTPVRQNVAGVTLAEVVHTQGRDLPAHTHPDPYLSLLLSGRYQDTVTGRTRFFEPADATFSPPGFEHRDRIGFGGARFFTISFDPASGAEYTERRALWETPQRWNAFGPAFTLARLHTTFVRSGGRLESLDVESCLVNLWGGLANVRSTESRGAAWLERARTRLHDELARPPRIVELATDAGVHPGYFTRAFRARFGVGPAEYRSRLRVMAACRALDASTTIRQVAIDLGYADVPHFTRDFATRVGLTPAAYRRAISLED